MKAAVMHEFGDVDVLNYEDIATPSPKAGHVLIKVLAAGVNRFTTTSVRVASLRTFPCPTFWELTRPVRYQTSVRVSSISPSETRWLRSPDFR